MFAVVKCSRFDLESLPLKAERLNKLMNTQGSDRGKVVLEKHRAPDAFLVNMIARIYRIRSNIKIGMSKFPTMTGLFPVSLVCLLLFMYCPPSSGQVVDGTADADEPAALFYKGQEFHENGDFEKAITFYQAALKIVPEFPEAEYQLGMALLSLNRDDEAEQALRRALELKEDWTLPMTSLGVLLVQNKGFEEAEQLLEEAIRLGGINFAAYSAMTQLRLKTGAPTVVLEALLAEIRVLTGKANSTSSIWASRAALERALGDFSAAKFSLRKALALDPADQMALLERAELALHDDDYETALIVAGTLQRISPDSDDVSFLFARIHAAQGDLNEALRALDRIKSPTSEVLTARDKIIALDSENIEELENRLVTDRINPAILGRLCVLLRREDPARALDYCRLANQAEPSNLNHAIGYGAALVQAKQYGAAIDILKRVLAISPDNYAARANLATALFQIERFEEAKREYIWITKTKPELAIAYYFLAISHDKLEEYSDAMANYQQFLRVADGAQNKLEIDKVNLRLPGLQRLIKQGKGKK